MLGWDNSSVQQLRYYLWGAVGQIDRDSAKCLGTHRPLTCRYYVESCIWFLAPYNVDIFLWGGKQITISTAEIR